MIKDQNELFYNLEMDIKHFHEKFGLAYNSGPRQLPEDLQNFRIKFLDEELNEYKEAVIDGNLSKQFDALIDLVYVAIGTAYLQGLPFNKGWEIVHHANMQKRRAERINESTRQSAFDVVKPEGWKAPDLTKLLEPTE